MLQQIAHANKTSLGPLLFIESRRSWLRGERESMCRLGVAVWVCNLPNTESSGSLVREKQRTCRVGIFGRPLGARTGEVIRQRASSKKGERTLLLDCGRRSRQ